LIPALESQDAVLQDEERVEIVRGKDLALENGEVDLDLIQPARMDRQVNQDENGPAPGEALHGPFAPVGGAIVHDPENALRGKRRVAGS
jgi:hypothetical protein